MRLEAGRCQRMWVRENGRQQGRRRHVNIDADRDGGGEHMFGRAQRVSQSMTEVNAMIVDALIRIPSSNCRAMIQA